jgi:hypothetical protein
MTIKVWHLALALVLTVAVGGWIVFGRGHQDNVASPTPEQMTTIRSHQGTVASPTPEQVTTTWYSTSDAATLCNAESDGMLNRNFNLDMALPNPPPVDGPMSDCMYEYRTLATDQPLRELHVGRAAITGVRASVPVAYVNGSGERGRTVAYLIRAGGVWKLDEIGDG